MTSKLGVWLVLAWVCLSGCARPPADTRPNVLLVIIDDLGWTDVQAYGSTFYETPNIDLLAAEGARFTQFYTASPVCSPTRASLMTGKHPARLHLTNWIGGEQKGFLLQAPYVRNLAPDEVTIGEALRDAGYTTGYIGKWHLGAEPHMPETQGFQYTVAVNQAGQPGSYFYPYRSDDWPATNVPGLEDGSRGEYLTDRLTDEALRFLDMEHEQPFLLVLSHYAVHTPLQAPDSLTAKYRAKASTLSTDTKDSTRQEHGRAYSKLRQDHPVYSAMVESTDRSIGRILDHLAQSGLDSSTVVFFVSDNGGLSTVLRRENIPTANEPLRAGKGWLYEGGVRAPMIVRWPGVIPPGLVVEQPSMSTDLFPTILAAAGLALQPDRHLDGVDLTPLLHRTGAVDRRPLFWHFPHYHGSGNRPSAALRNGDYKLVKWFESGTIELYDLSTDVSERTDLSRQRRDVASDLSDQLDYWLVAVDALMPEPNPEWHGEIR